MSGRVHLVSMTDDQVVGTSWVEVYSLAVEHAELVSFSMRLNTDKMFLRVTLDAVVTVDVDLDALESDFVTEKNKTGLLTSYEPNIWVFHPNEPQWTNGGFKIELKAQMADRRMEHGIVEWSEK